MPLGKYVDRHPRGAECEAYHLSDVQRRRDAQKDARCVRFEYPLLRINARYLHKDYRDMDLLSWFVHMWFASEMLSLAQAGGSIPWDEPLDPQWLMSVPGGQKAFLSCSHWTSAEAPSSRRIRKVLGLSPFVCSGKGYLRQLSCNRVATGLSEHGSACENRHAQPDVPDLSKRNTPGNRGFLIVRTAVERARREQSSLFLQKLNTETALFKTRYEFAGASIVFRKTST